MTLTATVARCSKLWRVTALAFALSLLVNGWPPANAGSFALPDRFAAASDEIPATLYKKALSHPWVLQARVQLAKLSSVQSGEPPILALASGMADERLCWTSARILRADQRDRCVGLWADALPDKTGPPQA